MIGIKERIYDIKQCVLAREVLDEKERILYKPLLTDYSLMDDIKSIVYNLYDNGFLSPNFPPINYFVFIVALLYSPRIFAGYSLHRGVRIALSTVLNVRPCAISNTLRNVIYWYSQYSSFQDSAAYIYMIVNDKLNEENRRIQIDR